MIFGIVSFLGAFLLFCIQLFIGKVLMPWFGGGAGIWITCMLFFQAALLGGYSYAHGVASIPKGRRQVWIHGALALLLLIALALHIHGSGAPFLPSSVFKPTANSQSALRILGLLLLCVGHGYPAFHPADQRRGSSGERADIHGGWRE